MPELPEVETVRRGLAGHLVGRTIQQVQVFHPRSLRHQPKAYESLGITSGSLSAPQVFSRFTEGEQILAVCRRGKYLWLELSGGNFLVAHLGMSGQMLLDNVDAHAADGDEGEFLGDGKVVDLTARTVLRQGPKDNRHLRIKIGLDDGCQLRFIDQRTFGYMAVCGGVPTVDGHKGGIDSHRSQIPVLLSHVARDLLDPALDKESLIGALRARHRPVKTVLLDQQLVSGIGSIYADEGCFAAGVAPGKLAHRVSAKKWGEVLAQTAQVMERAIAVGGTSFDSLYVDVAGAPGFFARSLQVYGRGGQECKRCGAELKKVVIQQRSAVYCPKCQRH